MATYLDGNVRKATENTVDAMRRSAENRKCPNCGRKSALVRDHENRQTYCRWTLERYAVHQHCNAARRLPMCDYVVLWDDVWDNVESWAKERGR